MLSFKPTFPARRSMQSIVKEISPEYSLEGLMLKLKLQYFGHLMWKMTHWKRPWCCECLKAGGEGDEMVGWHHQLNGREFEQTPGVGDRQGSLACCSPWGHQELDMTKWLNNNKMRGSQHQCSGSRTLECSDFWSGGLRACGRRTINFSHVVGVSVSAKQLKDIVRCIPEW